MSSYPNGADHGFREGPTVTNMFNENPLPGFDDVEATTTNNFLQLTQDLQPRLTTVTPSLTLESALSYNAVNAGANASGLADSLRNEEVALLARLGSTRIESHATESRVSDRLRPDVRRLREQNRRRLDQLTQTMREIEQVDEALQAIKIETLSLEDQERLRTAIAILGNIQCRLDEA